MPTELTNFDDVIDSRDVIARIDELEADIEDLSAIEKDELTALKALAAEGSQYSEDWEYGSILVRKSYFTHYVQELLEDIGDLPKDLPHYIAIDWEATARNLKVDYTEIDFDGVTYLVR